MTLKIIAGKHRGRALLSPKGKEVRPTLSQTREALFNLLIHGILPSPIIDQAVMDLCCGTGALGLEALSRGAAQAIFVDQERTSLKLAEENARQLGEQAQCRFIQASAAALPKASAPVALVMMDAPYHSGLSPAAFASLLAQGWLAEGTILAFEYSAKETLPELPQCEIIKDRSYGKARITILRFEPKGN